MRLIFGLLAAVMAFAIASVAGFFSITGMTTLFAAAYWPIVLMMAALEIGKLVTAGWLHQNWRNPRVTWIHKTYLSLAIFALMLITAIGIYGFLAKGFLDQKVPAASLSFQIAQREQQLGVARDNIAALNTRQSQLDAAVNSLIAQNYVIRSQALRREQRVEREQIQSDIRNLQQSIAQQSDELIPLKTAANGVDAKLGPIQYLADLFGWTHTDIAVRSVILILMFAFDPLAVVLLISGSISLTEWMERRKPLVPVEPTPAVQPAPVEAELADYPDQPIPPIIIKHVDAETDKQTVLAILQRNPGVVEDVIDTVLEWHEQRR